MFLVVSCTRWLRFWLWVLLVFLWAGPASGQAGCRLEVLGPTDSLLPVGPTISSNGARVAFTSTGDPLGANADGFPEVFLWDDATGLEQVTQAVDEASLWPALSGDGRRLTFLSSEDPVSSNGDGSFEIFLAGAGPEWIQITHSVGFQPFQFLAIDGDGDRIAFRSQRDLVGENPDHSFEIFLWDEALSFRQITHLTSSSAHRPTISADGSRIAFQSDGDLVGANPDGSLEIFLWDEATGFLQITDSPSAGSFFPTISGAGNRIAFTSTGDHVGSNPDGSSEVFIWDEVSGLEQVTYSSSGAAATPSLSHRGDWIAFVSTSDPLGTNPDGNPEIFRWGESQGLIQVTDSEPAFNHFPVIDGAGRRIAFRSDGDLLGGDSDADWDVFLATCPVSVLEIPMASPATSALLAVLLALAGLMVGRLGVR